MFLEQTTPGAYGPWLVMAAVICGMGGALGLWGLLLWRDKRYRRRQAEAIRRLGPYKLCEPCGGQGWLDKERPAAEWRRCRDCGGSGMVRYLKAV